MTRGFLFRARPPAYVLSLRRKIWRATGCLTQRRQMAEERCQTAYARFAKPTRRQLACVAQKSNAAWDGKRIEPNVLIVAKFERPPALPGFSAAEKSVGGQAVLARPAQC